MILLNEIKPINFAYHQKICVILTYSLYNMCWQIRIVIWKKTLFIEYSKETEPSKREKCYAWKTAIGLQDVDGLKTSDYLIETAKRNIEGDITIDEVQELLDTYYEEKWQKNR